jgi:flagellar basal-body rod modification protein FlgD
MKDQMGGLAAMVNLPNSVDNLMVRIENAAGELVRTFTAGANPAGESRVDWDGLDDTGNAMPAGKYNVKANGLVDGQNTEFDVSTYANVNSVLLGKGDGNVLLNLEGYNSPVKLAEVKEVGKG